MDPTLITYIVFGPENIDESLKDQAIARGEAVIRLLEKFRELTNRLETGEINEDEANKLWDDEDRTPLAHFSNSGYIFDDFEGFKVEFDDFGYLLNKTSPAIVADLIALWNHKEFFHDLNWKAVPGEKDRKVMVAGKLSWGDEEPSSGRAHQILESSWALGVFNTFGLTE